MKNTFKFFLSLLTVSGMLMLASCAKEEAPAAAEAPAAEAPAAPAAEAPAAPAENK